MELVAIYDFRCRVCGSDGLVPVGQVNGYDFYECQRCAFTFTPRVTRRDAAALDASVVELVEPDGSFLEPALARLPPGPLRILDFGAGSDPVATWLRADGHRVVSVDTSAPVQAHPDRLTGCLLQLRLPSASFDLAYAYRSFERLPEPLPYLAELLRVTRPGGLVAIRTDMESPERDAGFDRWWYVTPPFHCSFYRPQTFERALRGSAHTMVWGDAGSVVVERGGAGIDRWVWPRPQEIMR